MRVRPNCDDRLRCVLKEKIGRGCLDLIAIEKLYHRHLSLLLVLIDVTGTIRDEVLRRLRGQECL